MKLNSTKRYKAGRNSIITLTITGINNENREGVVDDRYAKFRTSSALVDDIENYETGLQMKEDSSIHNITFIYTLGEEAKADYYYKDINEICAPGIHYFKTREAAESWCITNGSNVKLEGLHREWDENGRLEEECTFKDGKEDGLYRSWYNNGRLGEECTFKDGKEDGLYRSWYKDGQPKLETNYKDGKLHGLCMEFSESGRLVTKCVYKDGEFEV